MCLITMKERTAALLLFPELKTVNGGVGEQRIKRKGHSVVKLNDVHLYPPMLPKSKDLIDGPKTRRSKNAAH